MIPNLKDRILLKNLLDELRKKYPHLTKHVNTLESHLSSNLVLSCFPLVQRNFTAQERKDLFDALMKWAMGLTGGQTAVENLILPNDTHHFYGPYSIHRQYENVVKLQSKTFSQKFTVTTAENILQNWERFERNPPLAICYRDAYYNLNGKIEIIYSGKLELVHGLLSANLDGLEML